MAVPVSTPDHHLIADLPATLAGLWTAVTLTQHLAEELGDGLPPEASERQAAVACLLAGAARSLGGSRPEAMLPDADLPEPWLDEELGAPATSAPAIPALASACIDLAVCVLGNEEEPLTSCEVLAITHAVTALCTTRSLAQGGIA